MLIADDDAGMRAAVSRLLSVSCDVVGLAVDVATVLDAAVRLRPDVVLLDFSLPGELNGLDVCRRLRTVAPDVKIVAFTGHDHDILRRHAYEAGCSGFVWKPQATTELLRTIHGVIDGAARSTDADTV